METIEILRGARELLADPSKWTKGVHARDQQGAIVHCIDPDAISFCMGGAVDRQCCADERYTASPEYQAACGALLDALKVHRNVVDFNDDPATTHQDMLDLFDEAIKKLEPTLETA